MIVCSCNVLSDAKIKSAIDASNPANLRTPSAVYKCLGCSPNCGRCFKTVRKIIDDAMRAHVGGHRPLEPLALDAPAHEGACDPACGGKCRAAAADDLSEFAPPALVAVARKSAEIHRPD